MRPSSVSKRTQGTFLSPALLFVFGVALSLSLIATSPAAANEEGIMFGGGVWEYLRYPDVSVGTASFSMIQGFHGNADGGSVCLSGDGGWFLVKLHPASVVLECREGSGNHWYYGVPGDTTSFVSIEGCAVWGVGKVVAANHTSKSVGDWMVLGAYEGEGSYDDYFVLWPPTGYPKLGDYEGAVNMLSYIIDFGGKVLPPGYPSFPHFWNHLTDGNFELRR